MLRIKMSKNRNVYRVLKDSNKETTALVNKITRRGGDRRLLRNALEVAIGQYVDRTLTAAAADHLNTSSFETHRIKTKPLGLEPILVRFYDGDIMTEDNLAYVAEKELLVATIDKLVSEEAKKFTDDITLALTDTKTLCGRVERRWDTKGDVFVLFQSTDLWLDKEVEIADASLRVPGKSHSVRSCTCGEFLKLSEESANFYLDRTNPRPTKTLVNNVFWYCKEDGRFFNVSDIKDEANRDKVIVAYIEVNRDQLI